MFNTLIKERFSFYYNRFDLNYINKHLIKNFYSSNRIARQDALWKRKSKSSFRRRVIKIELLNLIIKRAKYFAKQLITYYENRIILMIKNFNK